MKQMIKLEIRKAFRNKLFFCAIFIGCIITILSLYFSIGVYNAHLQKVKTSFPYTLNPLSEMFTVFNLWIGGEPFSLGTTIYFFIFPFLVSIPYGWSYCEETQNSYTKMLIVHTGRSSYYLSKYIAVFLSGGVTMILPLIFNFLLTSLFIPFITPNVIYDTSTGVFAGSLLSIFYYTKPLLYVILYLCIDFVFCGFIACIAFASSTFIKNRAAVVAFPFFLILAIHYSRQFIYTTNIPYLEISPLFFLRPVASIYNASIYIITLEGLIIFLLTYLISVFWEQKHDIY